MVPNVTTMPPFLSEMPTLPGAFAASGAVTQPSGPAGLDFAGLLDAAALPLSPVTMVPALPEAEPAALPVVSPSGVMGQMPAPAADMAGGRNLPEPGAQLPLALPVFPLPVSASPASAPTPAPVPACAPTPAPPEPLAMLAATSSADPVAGERPARALTKADAADYMPYPPPGPAALPAPAAPALPADETTPPAKKVASHPEPIVATAPDPLPAVTAWPQPSGASVALVVPSTPPQPALSAAITPDPLAHTRAVRAASMAAVRGVLPAGTAPDAAIPAAEPAPTLSLASATGLETPAPAVPAVPFDLQAAAQREPAPPPVLASLAPTPQTPAAADRAGEPRAPAPQVESAIEQVGSLREVMRSARPEMTLRHAEFGFVSLRLEQAAPDNWRAVLASRDPGFVPAIQAALSERSVAATSESAAGFPGQSGAAQNGTSDQRYGASPNGGQGSSQPYMGQSGSRDGEAAPDHRHASTSAAIAGRTEAEEEGSGGLAPSSGGLFA